jgi:hypothetical protein
MNYVIVTTDSFTGRVKPLAKKYCSFLDDLEQFKKELLENPNLGDDLGGNTRKVRMAIASKNKGKRGGARVITFSVLIDVTNTKIYLLAIYDKDEQDSMSKKEIEELKKMNGLV